MKTLYINTATQTTTIALFEGANVVAQERWPAEHNEAEKLQPAVEELLTTQKMTADDIGRLLACVGPGGFTSVRVGISAVNTWSFAKKIPVASVSVFDLYQHPEAIIVVSANSNEGWIKRPGKDPEYVRHDTATFPEKFSFAGIAHEDWRQALQKKGGKYVNAPEELPQLDGLKFEVGIVKPWYYKDANITWSNKHEPVRRLNPDR